MNRVVTTICFALFLTPSFAADYWQKYASKYSEKYGEISIEYGLDHAFLEQSILEQNRISVPSVDGEIHTFELQPSNVMAPALAEKFPEIRSFTGVNIDNPTMTGRFDFSHLGFTAMFDTNTVNGAKRVFIDPINATKHRVYSVSNPALRKFRHEQRKYAPKIIPDLTITTPRPVKQKREVLNRTPSNIITYRLAISANSDYVRVIQAQTVADVIANLTSMTNRLNEIFLVEIAAQFELVANNDQLIFLDPATDPFNNDSDDGTLNRDVQDDIIGVNNYDIGHIVNSDGGGLAVLGGLCSRAFKADGLSGIAATGNNDAFWVDIVAHEIGHQFGATHTFNAITTNCGDNRQPETSVEPGSGSTIMSYAGLCGGTNIARFAHDNFHTVSLQQMLDHRQTVVENQFGFYLNNCGTETVSSNVHPEVDAGLDVTIPAITYFELSASATDNNPGDSLTYSWEQTDPGFVGGVDYGTATEAETLTDQGAGPLIRAREPSNSPNRQIPERAVQRSGNPVMGESLPTTSRAMNFTVTVRDNEGGVAKDDIVVTVDNSAGPLEITTDFAGSFFDTNPIAIAWDVNGTDASRFNCATLDVFLSNNGGVSYEQQIASEIPNNGNASINLPVTDGRQNFQTLQLKCTDNIFFASHTGTFSSDIDEEVLAITGQSALSLDEDTSITLSLDDFTTNLTASTLTVLEGTNYTVDGLTVTPVENFSGTLNVNVQAGDGVSTSEVFPAVLTVNPVNDAPTATAETANVSANSSGNEISLEVTDVDADSLTITEASSTNGGSVEISGTQLLYTPADGFSGTETINYTVSDGTLAASSTVVITVTAAPVQLSVSGFNPTSTNEDTAVQIAIDDFSTNVPATAINILAGTNYTVEGTSITPVANFNGELEVNVELSNDDTVADVFVALINVLPVNDAPEVNNETQNTISGTGITVTVLSNDSDVDGDTLSVTQIDYSGTGSATLNDNIISYTPSMTFTGTESINYTVSDGTTTVIGTLTVNVSEPPPPVTNNPEQSGGSSGGSLNWLLLLSLLAITLSRLFKFTGKL